MGASIQATAGVEEGLLTEERKRERKFRVPTCCFVVLLLAAMIVAGVVFFVVSGKVRVQTMLDDIRARGEPVTAADLEPPAIPDSENAFVFYMDASRIIGKAPPDVDEAAGRMRKAAVRDWSRGDIELIRGFVGSHRESLRLVRKGARLKGYRSETKWAAGVNAIFPHMAKVRDLARLLTYKAMVDLADGRVDEAIDTCGDGMALSDHVGSEPTLISSLVGVACRAITLRTLGQVVSQARTPAQLEHVMRMLADRRGRPGLKTAMLGERAMGVQIYDDLRRGKQPIQDGHMPPVPGWVFYHDEAAYLSLLNEYVDLADKPYYEIQHQVTDIETRARQLPFYVPLAKLLMPIYSRAYAAEADPAAQAEVLRAAAAIKLYKLRHGAYPKKLSDLVPRILPAVPIDEFSGAELLYRRSGDGFVVYSIGQNGIDDGGITTEKRDSGDIVYSEQ
jgi:hypothetical protein